MPKEIELAVCVEHLIDLGLLERRPSIEWLQQRGLAFEELLQGALRRKAQLLLAQRVGTGAGAIGDILTKFLRA